MRLSWGSYPNGSEDIKLYATPDSFPLSACSVATGWRVFKSLDTPRWFAHHIQEGASSSTYFGTQGEAMNYAEVTYLLQEANDE